MSFVGPDTALVEIPRFGTPTLQSITVKAVCRRCNGGWMSRLEERVRPPLKELMAGDASAVEKSDVRVLGHWAMKSSFMYQLVDQSTRTVTAEQLRTCAEGPDAVPAAEVFVARYAGETGIWPCHSKYMTVRRADSRQVRGTFGVTTLVLGSVALAVIAASNPETYGRARAALRPQLAGWVPLRGNQELALGEPVDKAGVNALTAPSPNGVPVT
ncbi:hypothetical protein JOE31_001349 [Arthrobacter sp. PvP023]|uniref:hypothetical protein n=1 Tax=Micrococcaceae TaxID=1268 RepID=UPI001AE59515|nr:hypothetical protein [Arthrobacter sp. PvP023]MBP1135117.1 hypothetical protein [Arthrobacter sp. PvP023]